LPVLVASKWLVHLALLPELLVLGFRRGQLSRLS
jgi:hypothetical protein